MLLAAGRNLRHSDLQLLEMDRNATGGNFKKEIELQYNVSS